MAKYGDKHLFLFTPAEVRILRFALTRATRDFKEAADWDAGMNYTNLASRNRNRAKACRELKKRLVQK